jgi:ABC-type uncharacterized transport system substrate-binding protein
MPNNLMRFAAGGLVAFLALLIPLATALAHPHVFVDAKAEMLFDSEGRLAAVRHVWTFDPAFSAFAVQGLDKNHDGKLSADELAPLAKTNVTSLNRYSFFTILTIDGKKISLKFPSVYFLRWQGHHLTLFYQLPLKQPVIVRQKATLEVYDPEYFVAFTFEKKDPVSLFQAPAGCHAEYHPPKPINAQIMAELAAIPIDQHDLPPALRDAAVGLANIITMECTGS